MACRNTTYSQRCVAMLRTRPSLVRCPLLVPLISCACLLLGPCTASKNLPVVLWHGMGASCCERGNTNIIQKELEEKLGSYVLSITTGGSEAEQVYAGFFGNVSQQVEEVCDIIASREELQGGYNGVGLSQGGLFLRGVAERCQDTGPQMKTLVTLGSPHQGIMNIPLCDGISTKSHWNPVYWACLSMQRLLHWGANMPWVRDHVVQAQYFRDPNNLKDYLAKNKFLADLNNEHETKSALLRDNLASLEKLVLFRFADDFTVVPKDSAWFGGFYGKQWQDLRDTDLYMEDFIGLKELDKAGRLELGSLPGYHMHFSLEEFDERVIQPYLTVNESRVLASR